ncbi:MAG TPA: ATP-binding cassette domain-containing protein [Syntrophorhabdaceae bacterium]|nr:ATP-binding cassette domain-containing protein [Syntrophorhabdaceae bacterium]
MDTLLSVSGLKKEYEIKRSMFSTKKEIIKAVDSISFHLIRGLTLGIVGESGSGKSTLARCVLFLEKPDRGKIIFEDKDLISLKNSELRTIRKDMQIIFQDPYSSLNPRMKVFSTLSEPLVYHGLAEGKDIKEKVIGILKDVGLNEDFLNKYPHEMSGGQRQRVAIGRALTTDPKLIVADEPVSSLDVSIQAQIINLFLDIKENRGISMLFVSHDLNIVRFISDEIIVVYKGKIVEAGDKNEVFYNPLHPYTQMLIDSIKGDFFKKKIDYQVESFEGCSYYPRCNTRKERCKKEVPVLTGDKSHKVACFKDWNI